MYDAFGALLFFHLHGRGIPPLFDFLVLDTWHDCFPLSINLPEIWRSQMIIKDLHQAPSERRGSSTRVPIAQGASPEAPGLEIKPQNVSIRRPLHFAHPGSFLTAPVQRDFASDSDGWMDLVDSSSSVGQAYQEIHRGRMNFSL
jgi:hypothetical protein